MSALIESRHLQVFVTLVEAGTMREAAKRLCLTPSAVSHALKTFEDSLGCVLFDRTTRTLHLTQEGSRFLPEARRLLDGLENFRGLVREGGDWRKARLRIGASPTACQYLIPAVIREFKESCPQVSIQITQGSSAQLAQDITEGHIDLALSPRTPEHRNLEMVEIATDEMVYIVHPMHEWAKSGKVNAANISKQRYVLAENRSLTKSLIDQFMRRENLSIDPFIQIGNEEVIKELVRLDIGVGILPRWIASEELDKGLLVALPLGKKPPQRDWVLSYRTNRSLSLLETLFIGICRLVGANRIVI